LPGGIGVHRRPHASCDVLAERNADRSRRPAGEQESIGCDVNNLNRVVGAVTHDFLVASAATWQNGSWTLLPAIEPGAASDPLKPFVRLEAAVFVNIRGDIVAVGFDSRVPWRSKSLRLVRE
jgi:hypothetical protein